MEALEGEFGFDYRRLTQDCPLEMLEDKYFQTHESMFSPKVSLQRRPPWKNKMHEIILLSCQTRHDMWVALVR